MMATWTLGDFLAEATKPLCSASLPPDRSNANGHSTSSSATGTAGKTAAPPTAARRAYIQIVRNLGIIGVDQAMKAYDGMFSLPFPMLCLQPSPRSSVANSPPTDHSADHHGDCGQPDRGLTLRRTLHHRPRSHGSRPKNYHLECARFERSRKTRCHL